VQEIVRLFNKDKEAAMMLLPEDVRSMAVGLFFLHIAYFQSGMRRSSRSHTSLATTRALTSSHSRYDGLDDAIAHLVGEEESVWYSGRFQ
jgi:hypothetical protein